MKRFAVIFLILALLASLCACVGKPRGADKKAESWEPNPEGGTTIPSEANEAFRDAMENYPGVGYVPMAYLGSQVVAGTNYAYLCRNTTLSVEPVTTLTTVLVYKSLSGQSSILRFEDVNVASFASDTTPTAEMGEAGGWQINREYSGSMPADAQAAFDQAVEGLSGKQYMPLACLGSRTAEGREYAVLCTETRGEEDPSAALVVLVIFVDQGGNTSVSNITGFEIP